MNLWAESNKLEQVESRSTWKPIPLFLSLPWCRDPTERLYFDQISDGRLRPTVLLGRPFAWADFVCILILFTSFGVRCLTQGSNWPGWLDYLLWWRQCTVFWPIRAQCNFFPVALNPEKKRFQQAMVISGSIHDYIPLPKVNSAFPQSAAQAIALVTGRN